MSERIPAVSVIIPTYNRAHLVGRAIRSVLNQTFTDFELIVVDDASTDNTREEVESVGDLRIRYIRHEQRKGGSAARNTGIEVAHGEFLAFLDSDDEWLPRKLELQVLALRQAGPGFGIAFSGGKRVTVFDGSPMMVSETRPSVHGDISTQVFDGVPGVNYIGAIVKADKAKAIGGFDPDLRCGQDWDFIARLSQICWATSVPDVLAVYYYHEGPKIIRDLEALIAGTERIIEKHRDQLEQKPCALGGRYRSLASYCILAGHQRKALHYLLETLKYVSFRSGLSILPWFILAGVGPHISDKLIDLRRRWRSMLLRWRVSAIARETVLGNATER